MLKINLPQFEKLRASLLITAPAKKYLSSYLSVPGQYKIGENSHLTERYITFQGRLDCDLPNDLDPSYSSEQEDFLKDDRNDGIPIFALEEDREAYIKEMSSLKPVEISEVAPLRERHKLTPAATLESIRFKLRIAISRHGFLTGRPSGIAKIGTLPLQVGETTKEWTPLPSYETVWSPSITGVSLSSNGARIMSIEKRMIASMFEKKFSQFWEDHVVDDAAGHIYFYNRTTRELTRVA